MYLSSKIQYHIPLTVCHGDLHTENATCDVNRNIQIFDWNTAVLSHPFFHLLEMEEYENTDEFDTECIDTESSDTDYFGRDNFAGIRKSYLSLFQRYEPLSRLWEAYILVRFQHEGLKLSIEVDLAQSKDVLGYVEDQTEKTECLERFIYTIRDFEVDKSSIDTQV